MVKSVLSITSSTRKEREECLVGTELSELMGISTVSSLSGATKQAMIAAMQQALMEQLAKVCNQGGMCRAATPTDTQASGRPGGEASLGQGAL